MWHNLFFGLGTDDICIWLTFIITLHLGTPLFVIHLLDTIWWTILNIVSFSWCGSVEQHDLAKVTPLPPLDLNSHHLGQDSNSLTNWTTLTLPSRTYWHYFLFAALKSCCDCSSMQPKPTRPFKHFCQGYSSSLLAIVYITNIDVFIIKNQRLRGCIQWSINIIKK